MQHTLVDVPAQFEQEQEKLCLVHNFSAQNLHGSLKLVFIIRLLDAEEGRQALWLKCNLIKLYILGMTKRPEGSHLH